MSDRRQAILGIIGGVIAVIAFGAYARFVQARAPMTDRFVLVCGVVWASLAFFAAGFWMATYGIFVFLVGLAAAVVGAVLGGALGALFGAAKGFALGWKVGALIVGLAGLFGAFGAWRDDPDGFRQGVIDAPGAVLRWVRERLRR